MGKYLAVQCPKEVLGYVERVVCWFAIACKVAVRSKVGGCGEREFGNLISANSPSGQRLDHTTQKLNNPINLSYLAKNLLPSLSILCSFCPSLQALSKNETHSLTGTALFSG